MMRRRSCVLICGQRTTNKSLSNAGEPDRAESGERRCDAAVVDVQPDASGGRRSAARNGSSRSRSRQLRKRGRPLPARAAARNQAGSFRRLLRFLGDRADSGRAGESGREGDLYYDVWTSFSFLNPGTAEKVDGTSAGTSAERRPDVGQSKEGAGRPGHRSPLYDHDRGAASEADSGAGARAM
jgi:hypothetical protein